MLTSRKLGEDQAYTASLSNFKMLLSEHLQAKSFLRAAMEKTSKRAKRFGGGRGMHYLNFPLRSTIPNRLFLHIKQEVFLV